MIRLQRCHSIENTIGRAYFNVYSERKSSLWLLITFASQLQFWNLEWQFSHVSQLLTRWDDSQPDLTAEIVRGVGISHNTAACLSGLCLFPRFGWPKRGLKFMLVLMKRKVQNVRASIDKNTTTLQLSRTNLVTYLNWTPILECCVEIL